MKLIDKRKLTKSLKDKYFKFIEIYKNTEPENIKDVTKYIVLPPQKCTDRIYTETLALGDFSVVTEYMISYMESGLYPSKDVMEIVSEIVSTNIEYELTKIDSEIKRLSDRNNWDKFLDSNVYERRLHDLNEKRNLYERFTELAKLSPNS